MHATQSRGPKKAAELDNGSGASWSRSPVYTDGFGYELQRGFLSRDYYTLGTNAAAATNWSYSESQNRNDTVTNDLNQAYVWNGSAYVWNADLAGRTLTRGSGTTLAWDCVSRLTSFTSGTKTDTYEYRADGMRDHRHLPGSPATDWSYYHDGQTTAEDEQIQATALTVTRYGLGARGIDECERQTGTVSGTQHTLNSATSVWYPVYDPHGNQCGTISRSGSNSYTFGNVRTFDAWGNVRKGAQTGDPAARYCGSIWHVQDDESGLLYMRARYYDPTTGRFASEDPADEAGNWYVYCCEDPVNYDDASGTYHRRHDWVGNFGGFCEAMTALLLFNALAMAALKNPAATTASVVTAATFAAGSLAGTDISDGMKTLSTAFRILTSNSVLTAIATVIAGGMLTEAASRGVQAVAVIASAAYATLCLGALIWCFEP